MFKKKCSSKEAQSVGKSNIKSLKAEVLAVIGSDSGDLFNIIVGKKDTITKSKYQCGSAASAFVYFVNEVPFFISVDRISKEEQAFIGEDSIRGFSVVPTVFFFLRLHQLLEDKKEQWMHLLGETGAAVTCFSHTSRFLLSGAHLMMPGILTVSSSKPLAEGQVALIYTNGLNIPYAVGFVTAQLVSQKDAGVGVYVVHCFRDNLWHDHENRFLANYSLSAKAALIPSQFGESEVKEEALNARQADELEEPQINKDAPESAYETYETKQTAENAAGNAAELFFDENTVLTFCLCEAIRPLTQADFPLSLPKFTSDVVRLYPRDGAHTAAIQFADTKYKRALPFFQKFPDLLTIAEVSPGVHAILSVNKSAPVLREHKAKYTEFIETVHRKACEEEARVLQAKLLESGTAVFRQSIVNAGIFYEAPRHLDGDLARILLLGDELNIPDGVRFPTLEEVIAGTAPKYEPTPIDVSVFDEHYSRKTLVDHLKKYIQTHSLLIVGATGKGKMPSVKMDGTLLKIFSSKGCASELPLNQVEEGMLKLFRVKHEITLQTLVEGSSLASENLAPKRIVKSGNLPKVNVWFEKVNGNKLVTIVRNLDAFGFDLNLLARQWKKQFSSSCRVVDLASGMTNLKSGTKIPVEIHVQGNLVVKVEAALLNEANIPPSALVSKKP